MRLHQQEANRKAIGVMVTCLGLALFLADPVSATPLLSASTGIGGSISPGSCTFTGGGTSTGAPIGADVICNDTSISVATSAKTSAILGSTSAESRTQNTSGFSNGSSSGSASYADTVIFSGPGSGPISVALNLHFGGTLNTTAAATAFVNASASLAGSTIGSLAFGVHNGILDVCVISFSGLACGTSPNGTVTGSPILVPVNTPVSVNLTLDVGTSAFDLSTSATSLFSNTFGFVTGSPVFDLPAGFTADAGNYLVNNRFIAGDVPSPVPEPSTLALFGIGLGLGTIFRRSKAKA